MDEPQTAAGRALVRWFAETMGITEPGNNMWGEKAISGVLAIEAELQAEIETLKADLRRCREEGFH